MHLVTQCRQAKRWEAEPFRNLITFRLEDISGARAGGGAVGGGQGKGRKGVRGRGGGGFKKKKKEEEEELVPGAGGMIGLLPSAHSKVKVKESALRLRQTLHMPKEAGAHADGGECGRDEEGGEEEEYQGPQVDCVACQVPIKPEWDRCPLCSKSQKVAEGPDD